MLNLLKNPKFILAITIVIVIPFIGYNLYKQNKILGQKSQKTIEIAQASSNPSPTPVPRATFTPTPAPKLSKSAYTIALFGDSMVDTMGENLDYLQKSLKAKYPQTTFKLYNYGIGGENIEKGIARFTQAFAYQTRNYPPITQLKPDVIILGSFSYNPFPIHDAQKHYNLLKNLLTQAKTTGAQIYLLAEIAPLENNFGVGQHGVNWPAELANKQAVHIVEQIQNVINISAATNTPIINVYHESLLGSKFGNPTYVNSDDGIHPSVQGHVLTANLIAKILKLK